jgi:hypothetical protein
MNCHANESKMSDDHERYRRYQSSQSGEADLMSLGSTTVGSSIASPQRQQPLRYQYRKPSTPLPSSFWDSSKPRSNSTTSSRDRLKAAPVAGAPMATKTMSSAMKQPPHHHTATATTTMTIEVAPGLSVRLRGADETWRAIQADQYQPCTCLECNATMFCIQDAWLVLCPTCRVASPVNVSATANRDGGVALGFTMDVLAEGQASLWRDF